VISHYALVRLGLRAMIDAQPDRAVVVDMASQDGHLQHVDVALYDLAGLSLGDNDGDLQHLMNGEIPVVGIERDHHGYQGDGARALGVRLVVAEQISVGDLLTALEQAAGRCEPSGSSSRHGVLTERELAVIRMIALGMTNQEIAAELFLSINSVKTYIRTAYKKIGATSRSQAMLWALQNGLRPPTS